MYAMYVIFFVCTSKYMTSQRLLIKVDHFISNEMNLVHYIFRIFIFVAMLQENSFSERNTFSYDRI